MFNRCALDEFEPNFYVILFFADTYSTFRKFYKTCIHLECRHMYIISTIFIKDFTFPNFLQVLIVFVFMGKQFRQYCYVQRPFKGKISALWFLFLAWALVSFWGWVGSQLSGPSKTIEKFPKLLSAYMKFCVLVRNWSVHLFWCVELVSWLQNKPFNLPLFFPLTRDKKYLIRM